MTETHVGLGTVTAPSGALVLGMGGSGLMVSVEAHTDFHRFHRAGWGHPLLAGRIDVGGCPVLGLGWDPGDHSMRHRGERPYGQVYPATLEARAGETVLRWTIPPYADDPDDTA